MEHGPVRSTDLRQNAQHIIVRIAIVNDERQTCAFRDLDVRAKRGLLHDRIDTAPVVVETGFSNSADVGKLGQCRQLVGVRVGEIVDLVGVHGDCRVHVGEGLRGRGTPVRRRHRVADRNHPADADRLGGGDRVTDRAVHGVEVAVGVDRLDAQRLRRWRRLTTSPRPGCGIGLRRRCAILRPGGGRTGAHAGGRSSGSRGNSDSPLVMAAPAGSWPQRPASVSDCEASRPRLASAPNAVQSEAVARGMNGCNTTAEHPQPLGGGVEDRRDASPGGGRGVDVLCDLPRRLHR